MENRGKSQNVHNKAVENPTQHPVTDLREHLNRRRQQHVNRNEPPPDPRYNFLSDPLRDRDDDRPEGPAYDYYETRSFHRGYSRRPNATRGSRGQTRSRARGRGHYEPRQTAVPETEKGGVEQLQSPVHYKKDYKDKSGVRRQQSGNQFQTTRTNPTPSTSLESHSHRAVPFYDGDDNGNQHEVHERGRLRSYRGRTRSRGRDRGRAGGRTRYNSRHLTPVNIRVEFNSVTGEHKYSIEKIDRNADKSRETNIRKIEINDSENWEEDEKADAVQPESKGQSGQLNN